MKNKMTLLVFALLFFLNSPCISQIIFLHIHKCAGTTIHSLLEKGFHVNEVYPINSFNKDMSSCELISAHVPYSLLIRKHPNYEESFLFTCLRDPVDRVISEYRYLKEAGIVRSLLEIKPNMICNMLTSNQRFTDDIIVEDCIEMLKNMDFIIFFDDFDNDLKILLEKIQFPIFETEIPKLNVSKFENIDDEMIEKIKEANKLDIQVYEYARKNLKNFSARFSNTSFPQSYDSLNKLLERKKDISYTFDMPLQGSGWYHRQNIETKNPICIWIRNQMGSVYFNLDPSFDYSMQFTVKSITSKIKTTVKINEQQIEAKKLNNEPLALYELFIPKAYLTEELTKISFCANDSFFHNSIFPSRDRRKLSIALTSIELHHIEN